MDTIQRFSTNKNTTCIQFGMHWNIWLRFLAKFKFLFKISNGLPINLNLLSKQIFITTDDHSQFVHWTQFNAKQWIAHHDIAAVYRNILLFFFTTFSTILFVCFTSWKNPASKNHTEHFKNTTWHINIVIQDSDNQFESTRKWTNFDAKRTTKHNLIELWRLYW